MLLLLLVRLLLWLLRLLLLRLPGDPRRLTWLSAVRKWLSPTERGLVRIWCAGWPGLLHARGCGRRS